MGYSVVSGSLNFNRDSWNERTCSDMMPFRLLVSITKIPIVFDW